MINLLYEGQVALFFLIIISLVISLSFHEFGHAFVAMLYGDDTAKLAGRLTLNPIAHIDPMGLLMVVFVGFGYAKPVPTNPAKFTSRWADLMVSAAGPGMNLLVAFIAVNFYILSRNWGWDYLAEPGPRFFFSFLAQINLLLMIFNLIPLGVLDGHYMLPYLLSQKWGYYYRAYNARYGNLALLGLMLLSFMGIPVFNIIWGIGSALLPLIVIF